MKLPPEICAKICEDLGPKDRVTLCRTSRLFGDQAQRLIYRSVDLSHCTPRAMRSWCLAVTRRSQLAERVHALCLTLPSDLAFTSDLDKLARALNKCRNLKELSIHPDDSGPFGGGSETQSSSIQGWLVTKCPFRLTNFSNSYFRTSFLSQFWTPQADIRVLAIPSCTDRFPCYDDQLPNLVALEVGDVGALPPDRALQRIQVRWGRPTGLTRLSALGRYSATLTTLYLVEDTVTRNFSTLQIFNRVAHDLPGLLHFGITEAANFKEYMKARVADRFSEPSPISVLSKFTKLETFVIYCKTITGFEDLALGCFYKFGDKPSGLRTFGLAIMDACPTLRRADVGARYFPGPYEYEEYSKRQEWAYTLTRPTKGGDVELDSRTSFNFRAVAMFWNP
ncbi:hypothetical protein DFH06DRAFT_1343306 [Mycena polygramma]|nr:hypothetical protein DFH06DRAFT_1343306 [Mycena polygramma]